MPGRHRAADAPVTINCWKPWFKSTVDNASPFRLELPLLANTRWQRETENPPGWRAFQGGE